MGRLDGTPRGSAALALSRYRRASMRLLRLVLLAAMALLTVAFTGDGFAGCNGSGPPTGRPLPVASETACFAASDCPPIACEDRRCISGRCVEVGPFRDGDEDGEPPPPCGMDCDDTDARIVPGASESCNGRDDDCDANIDEDAPPGAIATPIGTASDQLAAAAIGDRIVLTDRGFSAGLRLRTADFEGHISTATPVTDETPELADLCAVGDGAVLVITRRDGAADLIEAFPLTLTTSGSLLVGASVLTLTVDGPPRGLRVEPFGDTFAIAWDEPSGTRRLMVPTWAAPVEVVGDISGIAPLDLATDGTNLAVASDSDTIQFFDVDGVALEAVTLPGRLGAEPIASSATDLVVGYRDTFDHVLARMTRSGAGAPHNAPAVGAGFPLRLDDTPLGVLVTRFDSTSGGTGGVSAQLLRPTLDTTIATFRAADVSGGIAAAPVSFDVIASSTGTAVITNFGTSGAVLTVLGCQPL
jgi:hypothetical protein